jgi:hypothetical protein
MFFPMIHVCYFDLKTDDLVAVEENACEELSRQPGYTFKPRRSDVEGEIAIFG